MFICDFYIDYGTKSNEITNLMSYEPYFNDHTRYHIFEFIDKIGWLAILVRVQAVSALRSH